MTRLTPTLYALAFVAQWAVGLIAVGVFAFGCIYFGAKLERAAYYYAEAERMDAMGNLYGSVKWAAVIEASNKKLEAACEKLPKKHRKGICPVES